MIGGSRERQKGAMAWGSGRSVWNHEALISSWRGREPRPPRHRRRRLRGFSESLPIPADASGAYRPNPQATTKLAPGPPSLKGYEQIENGGRMGNLGCSPEFCRMC